MTRRSSHTLPLASFLALLLLALLLPGPAISQPPLRVGAFIPFTGRWGEPGREWAKGMTDAAKWLNQRGGIYGRKLDVFLIDDTSQTAETMAAYRKLNEGDRVLLLTLYLAETALAMNANIHFDRIPTIVNTLSAPIATPSKYPYFFSTTPTPLDLSKIGLKFISERSGIKARKPTVVFVGSSDHLGRHVANEAKDHAKTLGLDLGPDIWVPDLSRASEEMSKTLSSALSALTGSNPDFAYLSLTPREAFLFLQEARTLELKTKWICSMRTFDETLISFDGVFGVQPVSPFGEDIPGMTGLKEAHQKWHPQDQHTVSYVEGWSTTQIIAEVLGRALPEQRLSRERIKSSLEEMKDFVLGGLVPPLTITPKDHRPSMESRIFTIKDGKMVRVTEFISLGR